MKSKAAPQTMKQKILKWLPLLGGYAFIYTWLGLGRMIYGFPDNPNHPFMRNDHWFPFYVRPVLYGVTVLVIMGLHGMALEKRVPRLIVLVSGLIGAFLLGNFTLAEHRWINAVTHVHSVSVDDQRYHLLKNDYQASPLSSAYVVLECDRTGLMCHYFATLAQCLIEDAHLEQDTVTKQLILRTESQRIPVVRDKNRHELYRGCEQSP